MLIYRHLIACQFFDLCREKDEERCRKEKRSRRIGRGIKWNKGSIPQRDRKRERERERESPFYTM